MRWYVVILVDAMPALYLTPTGLREFSLPEEERFKKIRRRRGSGWKVYDEDIDNAQIFTNKSEAEYIATEVPHSRVLSEMGVIRHV